MSISESGPGPSRADLDDLILAADVADDTAHARISAQLAALGVDRLDAVPGTAFDPTVHRAVATVAATSAADENTVDATVRPGWRHRGAMLRYVEVRVRVHPSRCPHPG